MLSFNHAEPPVEALGGLGPAGPFPRAPLSDVLERRWLHYAFLSRDGKRCMIANAAWLGPSEEDRERRARFTTILLLHERGRPWQGSQFNAETSAQLWSAFRRPDSAIGTGPLRLAAVAGEPEVALALTRTSRPCTSQCAVFAGSHHLRWQSETGVRARGPWRMDGGTADVDAVGYHERVRGRWGWPELDEWVFGFANDLEAEDGPPAWACVFNFIKPVRPRDAATASFMVWRDGALRRHFPRRCVSFAVRGTLDRDAVTLMPPLAGLLGVRPMAAVPKHLVISARLGEDWATLEFEAESCARIAIPSETSLRPFSVHEVVGPCLIAGQIGGRHFEITTRGVVEFSGGACG